MQLDIHKTSGRARGAKPIWDTSHTVTLLRQEIFELPFKYLTKTAGDFQPLVQAPIRSSRASAQRLVGYYLSVSLVVHGVATSSDCFDFRYFQSSCIKTIVTCLDWRNFINKKKSYTPYATLIGPELNKNVITYTGRMKNLCKFKQLLSLMLLERLFAWASVLFFKTTAESNLYSCQKVHGSGITYNTLTSNVKRMDYILQKQPPYFPIKMLHIQTLLLDTRDKHLSCQSWWIYKIEF